VRLLALYDIHGNVEALEAVLADPRAARPGRTAAITAAEIGDHRGRALG
jgi:hypothetical protein